EGRLYAPAGGSAVRDGPGRPGAAAGPVVAGHVPAVASSGICTSLPSVAPATPSVAAPSEPANENPVPTPAELIAAHVKAMERKWGGQTRLQNAATFRLLLEWTGDRTVDRV